MRRVCLLRHARPDVPPDKRLCLGRTDLPLGALGRMQACRTAVCMADLAFEAVYTSPLKRAAETAGFFSPAARVRSDLREIDCGDWDGLDFSEIQRRWPELYAARGRDLSLPMPNGETAEEVKARAGRALEQILAETTGDVLIVAHSFVIRSLLGDCGARLPYASLTILGEENAVGMVPETPLTPGLADLLLTVAAPGAAIEAHCRAVEREARRICDALPLALDADLLSAAALLHDVARAEPDHAKTAARWLRELGYESAAYIVGQHHDHDSAILNEGAILYLADKCVLEDRVVPLAERFAESEAKCLTEEAKAAHARRYAAAERLREEVNAMCQTEVVR